MSVIANSNQSEEKPKTSQTKSYWQIIPWKNLHWQKLTSLLMAIALCFYLSACGGDNQPVERTPVQKVQSINITEVAPPREIQRLSRLLDRYEPQISILSPQPDEVLNDTQVTVKFDVQNLPIFKNADFGLGPHIHVTLDNQEYNALYDLHQAVIFDHLSPGTHTIRAFASRPWHESFKNQGAYAQVTFHVFTKTDENNPDPQVPLLTYSRPVGTYGAEPILLDFYLQNVSLDAIAQGDNAWQIRATVNGQSFTFDRWEPIYLEGFQSGKNWVKLELIKDDGQAIANVFNSTAHGINLQPNGQDTLSRLVRGEEIANIEAIVNPDYVPPTPTPVPPTSTPVITPTPTIIPVETPTPVPPTSTPVTTPTPAIIPVETATPIPAIIPIEIVVTPAPVETATPIPTSTPSDKVTEVPQLITPTPKSVQSVPEAIAPKTEPSPTVTPLNELTPPQEVIPAPEKAIPEQASNANVNTPINAPITAKDYLKNIGYKPRRVFSNKHKVTPALQEPKLEEPKLEEPKSEEPKSEFQATENP